MSVCHQNIELSNSNALKKKITLCCENVGYLYKTNTIVFTILVSIQRAKLHLSSTDISSGN